jgi:hypothetical protein
MASVRGEKLTAKQERAITALLEHPTIVEAAAAADTDERTLRRWLALPVFLAAYRQARLQVVEASIARLQRASGAAVTTLEECLGADKAGDRIRAAVAILEYTHKGAELLDLAGQVAELKAQIEGLRGVHIFDPAAGSESPAEEPPRQQGAAGAGAGADPSGSGGDPGGGGNASGPLAGEAPPLFG